MFAQGLQKPVKRFIFSEMAEARLCPAHAAGDFLHFVKALPFGLEKRFRVISLVDNLPALMASPMMFSYDDIFVEQPKNFIQLAISSLHF